MTITILENEKTAEGSFLPHSYVVQYWDAGTERLLRTETVQDTWQRVGAWDLPVLHTVTTATDTGLSVRQFTLSKHVVLGEKLDSRLGAASFRDVLIGAHPTAILERLVVDRNQTAIA